MAGRASGVLLHPTSLPGRHGVGDLGPEARRFVDRLADGGVRYWQMLPVTAPGAFGSPYECRSAFAGNWLLISPQRLVTEGLLPAPANPPAFPADKTDLVAAAKHKEPLLRASWEHFSHRGRAADRRRFEAFRAADAQRLWLEDWSLFAALSDRFGSPAWNSWPSDLRDREPAALDRARRESSSEIDYQCYLQHLFFTQFEDLRQHAHRRGVRLFGDLPMYPSHSSADVWAHPELFDLDADGRPLAAGGVPPDAFSTEGQLWGNPVYRWPLHRQRGYSWWIDRLRAQARLFDLLRLDHFRGFLAYWRVPLPATDARGGRWCRGPGHRLFAALASEVGQLGLVAEDLGVITPGVDRLRRRFGLPGMKVLQFAFDEEDSAHLPETHEVDSVVYTGTHDNDTLLGWCETLAGEGRERLLEYLGAPPDAPPTDLAWQVIGLAMSSDARLAVIPLQDLIGLGSNSRMNTPGTAYDNWRWRLAPGALTTSHLERLKQLLTENDRLGGVGDSAQ